MRVAIGAITRRRPKMFGALLDSFATMQRPEGVELIFLFAENDDAHQAAEVVEAFRARVPEPVQLGLEPRQGIPMGRNKVLDMALAEGADFLTFVDDDEVVDEGWLVTLIEGALARGLELAGGPVRLVAPDGELTDWNRAVLKHLQKRAEDRVQSKNRRAREGRDGDIDVYTNNWCLCLAAQRRLGVRFDEALQFTGGSDTKFSRDFHAAGGRIGFVPGAFVDDPMPQKRLTLGYHFRRARDQSNNAVVLGQKSMAACLGQTALRLFDAGLNLLTVPLTGRYGVVKAVHKLPEREPDRHVDIAMLPQSALIYRLSGDHNPLHASPTVARAAGFEKPILHGLCTLGVAGRAILQDVCNYDATKMKSLELRFSAPVYPGETIRTEIWQDGTTISFRARVVERDVVVLNNGKVVVG